MITSVSHQPPNLKHGKCNTSLYSVYSNMKNRCYNQNSKDYKNYGGRGITICDDWLDNFESFYNWSILNGYSENLFIDRIDNNRGYCPENCRWVDRLTNNNNRRDNDLIEYQGEVLSISQWSQRLNINRVTLIRRFKRGWSVEKTFSTPVDTKYRNGRTKGGIF